MINVTSFLVGILFGTALTFSVVFAGYCWKNFIGDDEDSWKGNKETKN